MAEETHRSVADALRMATVAMVMCAFFGTPLVAAVGAAVGAVAGGISGGIGHSPGRAAEDALRGLLGGAIGGALGGAIGGGALGFVLGLMGRYVRGVSDELEEDDLTDR